MVSIFKSSLPDSQIKKHRYYGVRFKLKFAFAEPRETFLRCEKYRKSPIVKEGFPYDTRYEFYTNLMPKGQKKYLGYNSIGVYRGINSRGVTREERRSALYGDKLFISSIEYNEATQYILISIYLKPSLSITQALRVIKQGAKNWYSVIHNHGGLNPYHPKAKRKSSQKRLKRLPCLDHESKKSYFEVFELPEQKARPNLQEAA